MFQTNARTLSNHSCISVTVGNGARLSWLLLLLLIYHRWMPLLFKQQMMIFWGMNITKELEEILMLFEDSEKKGNLRKRNWIMITEKRHYWHAFKRKKRKDTDITTKTRKISLGWLNYDEKFKNNKHAREIHGGGRRPISVPSGFTKEDILQEAIKMYLPKEDKLNMEVELGKFKVEAKKEDDLGMPLLYTSSVILYWTDA